MAVAEPRTDAVRCDRIMRRYYEAILEPERRAIEAAVPEGWWIVVTAGHPDMPGTGTARLYDATGTRLRVARGRVSAWLLRSLLTSCYLCHRVEPIAYGTFGYVAFAAHGVRAVCDDCRERERDSEPGYPSDDEEALA